MSTVFVEATDRALLLRTAEHLDALAEELTTRLALGRHRTVRRGRERDIAEQRAKYYRIAHDLRALAEQK